MVDPTTLGVMVSGLFFIWFLFFIVWWVACAFIWAGY